MMNPSLETSRIGYFGAASAQSKNGVNHHRTEPAKSFLEELRDEIAEGLLYSHSRANANTSKVLEVASFSYALIELLIERGVISVEELDERKKIVGQRLVEKFVEKGMGVALTKDEQDKYSFQSEVRIDCENRLHVCRAACCRLGFALSAQDVEEGKVKWDLGHPYMIRHDADGYCHHIERNNSTGVASGCNIYENRPIVCRAYDCRKDKRIWVDFDQKIVSPELEKLFKSYGANGSNGSNGSNGCNGSASQLVQICTPSSAAGQTN